MIQRPPSVIDKRAGVTPHNACVQLPKIIAEDWIDRSGSSRNENVVSL